MRGREIHIHVLDLDAVGPAFGARSLTALQAEGGPLHGLDAVLEHLVYDWSDPVSLAQMIAEMDLAGAVLGASTEGGLFEYGSDADILANLEVLHASTSKECFVVGSMFRDAPVSWCMKRMGGMSFLPRQLESFRELVAAAGWKVACSLDGNPVYHVVNLAKQRV